MKRVVVVGGGITGLSCAYRLKDTADVTVLEAGARRGGNLLSVREDGFVLDAGPDAWVASKPHATRLAKDLGLEGDMVGTLPDNRRVYVAFRGKLYPLPEGLVLGVPTRIGPMVTTRLFSPRGKLRMGLEPLVPVRRFEGDDDESVHDFIARRLGAQAAERLAGPLLGGIFAGDPRRLSVRAAFPQLLEMEQKHGSLVLAMRAARRRSHGSGPPRRAASKGASAFLSLRGGIARLAAALADALGDRVRTGARVVGVAREGDAWRVDVEGGEPLRADHVVLTATPCATTGIVRGLDAELADLLGGIRVGSSAVVFLGYRREQVAHPLDATGFISVREPDARLIAATWVTSKWPGRAPEGHVLLRAFFGGVGHEHVLAETDDALVATARAELAGLMGELRGEPVLARVFRWNKASPQPEVGHLARMASVRRRLDAHPGLHLAGNGYFGNGIPDCIKQAEAVAEAIDGP